MREDIKDKEMNQSTQQDTTENKNHILQMTKMKEKALMVIENRS